MDEIQEDQDLFYMELALRQAELAFKEDEVPVGAVLVGPDGEILAETRNQMIALKDPTAHAEILAIREGAKKLGNYRLLGCKLYVTLEPCPMCAYAIVLARIEELIYATPDPKTGACGSIYNIPADPRLNHQVKIRTGPLREKAEKILKDFFIQKRQKSI